MVKRLLMDWWVHFKETIEKIENSPVVKLVTVLGFFAVFVSLYWQWGEILSGREERKQEAIARNWSILTTQAPGNSGKVSALQYLAFIGQPLEGIDLSCSLMNGLEKIVDENGQSYLSCEQPVYLVNLQLNGNETSHNISLRNADFRGADLFQSQLIKVDLSYTDLVDTNLVGAKLNYSNLSSTYFHSAIYAKTDFTGTWAWSDTPPESLSDYLGPQYFCEPDNKLITARRKRNHDTVCKTNPKYIPFKNFLSECQELGLKSSESIKAFNSSEAPDVEWCEFQTGEPYLPNNSS